MTKCDDAANLTPQARFEEIASILATGILRLRRRLVLPVPKVPKLVPESRPEGLDVPAETRLSVRVG